MSWGADIRAQVERDARECARLRGALTPDVRAPQVLEARVEEVIRTARRRVVKGRMTMSLKTDP